MQSNILFLSCLMGALGVLTYIQAVPIEVVYGGDTCQCPKKLDYEMDIPIPPIPKPNIPIEHDYNVDCPLKTARVTYSFDFDVEQPIPKLPMPEKKLDIYAKIDRLTALKKDCYATHELPRTCGCYRCASSGRYVLPESSAARITRNARHPNSLEEAQPYPNIPTTPKIVAIFFKPPKQAISYVSRKRSKRDISRIFKRPKKAQKHSDRVVKQYNKRLKDISASERTLYKEAPDLGSIASNGLRPLETLSSFLKLPRLRNKRDIKGEYDLIEKDREQMDLTLPEIIQFMPETLDPNFKRNQCNFARSCRLAQLTETTTTATNIITTTTMKAEPSEAITTMAATQTEAVTRPEPPHATEANSLKHEVKKEKQTDTESSSMFRKRKARNNFNNGCPVVIDAYDPTPAAIYTYNYLADLMVPPTSFNNADLTYHQHPLFQQYIAAPYHSQQPPKAAYNEPTLGAAYAYSDTPEYSNAQLDETISAIVHKHSDFLEISTKRDQSLVDPTQEQKERTVSFLKSLLSNWGDWSWFGERPQHQYPTPSNQYF